MPRVLTRPAPAVAATHDSPTLRTRHDRQARAHARALKKNRASRGHTTRADDYDLVPIINVSSCPSSTCSLPRFGGSIARFGVLAPLRRPIARICTALAELPSLGERCMCVCIKYCTRFCPRIRALPPIIMHAIYELLARLPRAHAHRLLTTDCPSPPVSAVVARTNANTTAGRLPPRPRHRPAAPRRACSRLPTNSRSPPTTPCLALAPLRTRRLPPTCATRILSVRIRSCAVRDPCQLFLRRLTEG